MTTQPDPVLERIQWVTHDPIRLTWAIALMVAAMAFLMAGEAPIVMLLIPVVLVCIAASIRYPMVALWLLVAIMVSNASQNLIVEFGLPSIAKLAAPGMFVLFAARFILNGERPYIGWLALSCLLIVLGMKLVSALYARNWEIAFGEAEGYLKDVVFALLALGFLAHKKGFQTVMNAAPVTVAIICALGMYQLVFGRDPGGFHSFALIIENSGRFSGPLEDANFFGVIIVFATPLALFQVLNARSPVALIIWSVIAGLLIAGLVATNSRGGLIGLAFALSVMAIGLSFRQLALFFVLGVVGAAIAFAAMGEENRQHFATIIGVAASAGEVGDQSTEGRLASWQVAIDLFRDQPLLGVGVGNFNLYYQDRALELGLIFRGEGRSTHSLYLEFLAEQGIIGLSIVLTIFGVAAYSIVSAVKTLRRYGDERAARQMAAFGAGIAGYLFAMSFLQDSFPRFLWFVVALAIEARFIVAYHYEGRRINPFA